MMLSFEMTNLPELWEMDVVECSGAWNKNPRKAIKHLFEIIYQGEAAYTLNGREHILKAGDMVFIPQNDIWQSRTNNCSRCRFFYVFFSVEGDLTITDQENICHLVSSANEVIHENRYYCPKTPPASNFSQVILPRIASINDTALQKIKLIISQMREERDNPSTLSGMKLSICFAQILALITEVTISNIQEENCIKHRPHLNPLVTQAVRYMRLHFNNKITLSELCRHCNSSPQHLIRLFKSEFKQTPIEFLTNIRLGVAKEMMLHSNLAFKEIAGEVGIDNPLYFSRIFKQYEGISPREYRNRYQKQ